MPDSKTVLPDYFIDDGSDIFAGIHLLVHVRDARKLTNPDAIEKSLVRAAEDARATVLNGHFHSFGSGLGVSGVLLLAESHISIHTWPERRFASIDVFMCGKCNPYDTLPEIKKVFSNSLTISASKRGLNPVFSEGK